MRRPFILAVLVLLANSVGAQTSIRVAVSEGLEAYEPIVSAVYREIGLAPLFDVVPSPRALTGVELGTYGADLGRTEVAALAMKNCTPTAVSILDLHLQAVYKEGLTTTPLTAQDLGRYDLVYVRGSKIAEALVTRLGLQAHAHTTSDLATLARLLTGGRAQVGLLTSATPIAQAGKGAQGLVTQKESLLDSPSVHVFNNKYAEYAPRWDAVLLAMKNDGRLAKLLAAALAP